MAHADLNILTLLFKPIATGLVQAINGANVPQGKYMTLYKFHLHEWP